ncbi:sulfurtransferase [Larsenimonas rhizosphaerae]|uniref:sulfurtransferase n=1 Tax=Larsenimonas rhizosphaerae TaxID=2944682 RepID=UPI002033B5AF|nr:sulfurtransferase [Larsenimonas rhizosphaerae]MCM2132095.1 sulfurtransferase [Larsenimonas rhizosphaerae]
MSTEDNLLGLIIEPDQLAPLLGDERLLIIDVPARGDSYREGHVPGAVFLDHTRLMAGSNGLVANDVPDEEALSALFSSLGLTRDTHVVAYDDEGGGWAGRLLWTLELMGHTRYSYLNGGIHAWRGDDHPVETEDTLPTASDYQAEIRNAALAMDADAIRERIEDTDFAIWDARSPDEYNGVKGKNRHLGHIPGAINIEWTEAMDPARQYRLRDYAELVTLLGARGLSPEMDIVTHCQSHHRSGFTWLVGRALGYEHISAYPGSWADWGNRDDTPIES